MARSGLCDKCNEMVTAAWGRWGLSGILTANSRSHRLETLERAPVTAEFGQRRTSGLGRDRRFSISRATIAIVLLGLCAQHRSDSQYDPRRMKHDVEALR
jgi:hypothetical protein